MNKKLEKFATRLSLLVLPHESEGIRIMSIPFQRSRLLNREEGLS